MQSPRRRCIAIVNGKETIIEIDPPGLSFSQVVDSIDNADLREAVKLTENRPELLESVLRTRFEQRFPAGPGVTNIHHLPKITCAASDRPAYHERSHSAHIRGHQQHKPKKNVRWADQEREPSQRGPSMAVNGHQRRSEPNVHEDDGYHLIEVAREDYDACIKSDQQHQDYNFVMRDGILYFRMFTAGGISKELDLSRMGSPPRLSRENVNRIPSNENINHQYRHASVQAHPPSTDDYGHYPQPQYPSSPRHSSVQASIDSYDHCPQSQHSNSPRLAGSGYQRLLALEARFERELNPDYEALQAGHGGRKRALGAQKMNALIEREYFPVIDTMNEHNVTDFWDDVFRQKKWELSARFERISREMERIQRVERVNR